MPDDKAPEVPAPRNPLPVPPKTDDPIATLRLNLQAFVESQRACPATLVLELLDIVEGLAKRTG